MGRKDFVQDVKILKEHFRGLNSKSASLVQGFDFQDPELSFRFGYKIGKSITVQIFVNVVVYVSDSSLQSYPTKFSAFVCVDAANEEEANIAAKCLSNVNIENKTVSEIVATIIPKLCDYFRIALPKDLSMNALIPVVQTPVMLLNKDLAELKHFRYNAELLCADEIGFKIVVSMPVIRLGLSLEACEAWNLDPERFLVCIMQFSPSYIDLQGVISNALQTKAYLIKEGGSYQDIKDSLKKQFPITFTVLTSSLSKGMPSQSHHKDDTLESDHFVLSWTLTELLRQKFFDMLCDRMWFGIGWSGAEYADLKRNKELKSDFLNSERSLFNGQVDECLSQDEEQHGVLCYLESEEMEVSTASANRNFLLLVLRFLRRRILLSTKYCLTCHYPHTESVSSIRPFVCGSALCQHQALVGLGNLFEAVLVNSPVVVDLLISLCHVAISGQNLSPFPSRAIGVTTTTKFDVQNSLVVDWDNNIGTVGTRTDKGYTVYGWKGFDDQVLVNDMLEVFHPETGLPFTVNRCSHATSVRVLEVSANTLIIDFPITVSTSTVPNRHVYLPFRVHRRSERNFLNSDNTPNYSLILTIIDKLPAVNMMVQYAKKKILKSELDKLDPLCFPLLSWIISSNRTHLRLLESEEEKVQFNQNDSSYNNWKQFVMIMSSPEKEETFQREKEKLRNERRGQALGELFAFHGSPLHNWHSIIRTSLNWKKVVHGRAFGDGVYHSLQAQTSSSYAGASYYHRQDTGYWKNSMLVVQKCMALSEIVNRPLQFISTNPHLVVQDESWITTRYLFVECLRDPMDSTNDEDDDWTNNQNNNNYVPSIPLSLTNPLTSWTRRPRENSDYITLDHTYTPLWLNNQPLQIPIRDFSIINNDIPDESSIGIGQFNYDLFDSQDFIKGSVISSNNRSTIFDTIDEDTMDEDEDTEDDMDAIDNDDDDFEYDDNFDDDGFEFQENDEKNNDEIDDDDDDGIDLTLLPIPAESSKGATQRICKELRTIIHKQSEPSNDLGFFIDTNKLRSVYQWVVQLTNFDSSLPLAQDMARNRVNSIDLEVRFAPDYPFVPPYVRVIRPRLLRFMDGGGGHVTAGGSICMDLLTLGNERERGWSSVYTMEAVLLQIKIALSSLDPKPARLDRNWNCEYSPGEAIDAYIRVANQHGWAVPQGWSSLFGR
ncbi:12375_t:CDS:10 [Funneliformis geosporum]|uniref:14299_t:CDS:1 n=1 Tax=Funneliformis geosporum TaxID=1117311 RepID=A0A9W4SN55_9GLOM|nr:12375_t:CDS:10 [Funneliformis geosporum]CAI2175387.1 14299_t:CDS:10 [Funneliformis geosporum]